jgi:hypothetical protein
MSEVLFDFRRLLHPHGEDRVSYEYKKGNLNVEVQFEECAKRIDLEFIRCAYQYFAPIPGHHPNQIFPENWGSDLNSGCVFELVETKLLMGSEQISERAGYKANRKHFFLYLDTVNVAMNIIARECRYSVNATET